MNTQMMNITKCSGWIRPNRRLAIYLRDNWTCIPCGASLLGVDPNMVTLDHIVSKQTYKQWSRAQQLAFGSINKTTNLVTCCKPCNSSKKHSDNYKTLGAEQRVECAINKPLNMELANSILNGDI